jgi:hypothetical protein
MGSSYGLNASLLIDLIAISDSNVAATSGLYGSGIGSGYSLNGPSSVMNLLLHRSNLTVLGLSGPGIGSGCANFNCSIVFQVLISESIIHAIGGNWSAGLGSGWGYGCDTFVYNLTVANSSILLTVVMVELELEVDIHRMAVHLLMLLRF